MQSLKLFLLEHIGSLPDPSDSLPLHLELLNLIPEPVGELLPPSLLGLQLVFEHLDHRLLLDKGLTYQLVKLHVYLVTRM